MAREYKYIVIGRCTSGVNVIGYVIQSIETGQSVLMERKEVESLALNKFIGNVTAQIYDEKVVMKGINCKLNSLPNYDSSGNIISRQEKKMSSMNEIAIQGRILSGKSTVGYVVTLLTNGIKCGEKKLSRDKVLELARDGYILNARVQMSNGNQVLRGVNCELAKLPSIRCS